jgi:hypothetical protein
MRTHAKSYSNEEFVFRWNVWRENHRFIEEHNRQNHSYHLAMNQFGDLTADEFRTIYTGPGTSALHPKEDNATSEAAAAAPAHARRHPASIDWRTWGGVQAVKNQGTCPPPRARQTFMGVVLFRFVWRFLCVLRRWCPRDCPMAQAQRPSQSF